ncbi:FAD-dependent oxidoreductase [Microbacterium sp. RD1]|uniref:FAD-dependent oxidoreductase n=1 Tax=Microbacterium sp. RD1 TaxID=3457313 RepID=UPI003FA5F896
MPDVVVVGAGPVGTLLSAELVRRGVDVAVIERRRDPAAGSRAIGIHAPVLAALEASGVTERLLARATRVLAGEARSAGALLGVVRFDRLSRRFPFVATLPQPETRAALAVDAPAPIFGEVTAVRASAPRVIYRDDDGMAEIAARIVVVAAGPRSRGLLYRPGAVREQRYPDRYVMADITAEGGADAVVHLDRGGVLESFPLPGGVRRFVAPGPVDLSDDAERARMLRDALRARGLDTEASAVDAADGFEIRRSLAPRLRRGPVFAIGDLAHEVSPMGGQGMNLGLLDAATLAPLLAAWMRTGEAPESALRRWERRRLASARTSGAIATANTLLGRPASARGNAVRALALRGLLATPAATLLAHAYAMGFDRNA